MQEECDVHLLHLLDQRIRGTARQEGVVQNGCYQRQYRLCIVAAFFF